MSAQTTTIAHGNNANLLRRALQGNAAFSGISGLILFLFSSYIAPFLGLKSATVLIALGLVLVMYAPILVFFSLKEPINRSFAITAVVLDVLWVFGSLIIIFSSWVPLSIAGKWVIGILADIVLIFAILQSIGIRRLDDELS